MRANCARKQAAACPVDTVRRAHPEGLQGRNRRHKNPMTLGALTSGVNLAEARGAGPSGATGWVLNGPPFTWAPCSTRVMPVFAPQPRIAGNRPLRQIGDARRPLIAGGVDFRVPGNRVGVRAKNTARGFGDVMAGVVISGPSRSSVPLCCGPSVLCL